MTQYINGDYMLFLCIKIFFVRILDVSLGTIRTIMTVKNKNLIASIIGFVEITIWFLVVKEAINTESNSIFIVLSYALGFSTGTYIGGIISYRYIKGYVTVHIITSNKTLAEKLRENKYGVTKLKIDGLKQDDKEMLIVQISNKRTEELKLLISKTDPKAFLVISDTKYIQNGFIKE